MASVNEAPKLLQYNEQSTLPIFWLVVTKCPRRDGIIIPMEPVSPIPHREITREEVEAWLKQGCLRQFNIMNSDQNAVIVHLCRTLLKEWDKKSPA